MSERLASAAEAGSGCLAGGGHDEPQGGCAESRLMVGSQVDLGKKVKADG
ncbi:MULTISPECIES: hypothetical protein [Gluconobacter]|uniref:Uncharacterized protein n=1 Tax=Gluconobacter cadivus TaxID=2728101 RepID=A0ABR9YXC6_9PROT|nr:MULTISPECIES: hypothetical protein [Gluconobacter]MBF0888939.1 hypothetical protein [Gluconobacter cadivus]MBS1060285.1 hypothetical protein [Gluconobacter sp. Dm-44]